MKAVILAAGRGRRLGKLTKSKPKPLILINGRPLITYVLNSLPKQVKEIIIVINYLGSRVRKTIKKSWNGKKIKYVEQGKMSGTAGALWAARKYLKKGKFLVLNGDDFYQKRDINKLADHNLSMGVSRKRIPSPSYFVIDIDYKKRVVSWHKPIRRELHRPVLIATGAYVLSEKIFNYKPVKTTTGEYGLPQTIFCMVKDFSVKSVLMNNWLQVNFPDDIKKAENFLKRLVKVRKV